MKKITFIFLMVLSSMSLIAQEKEIRGTVTDESNEPLPGVNIVIQGTTIGQQTDFDGNYTIKANVGDVLVYTFIGMVTQTHTVTDSDSTINIVLTEDANELEEVVVVGYGVQKKENLTGAISVIDSEQIENRPVVNMQQALQGAAPGLQLSVGNAGGEVGANMNISIRGVGSLTNGSGSPLVIVDDIPLDDPSEMNDLNPNDIESISVLKDAASSAIYGSRAAFGVIIIKSKSGEIMDGHKISYSNNFNFASPLNLPEMMNSVEFANYFNLAATNGGSGAVFSDEVLARIQQYFDDPVNTPVTVANDDNTRWQQYTGSNANTDWFDVMYKDQVVRQQHDIRFSGKQKGIKYYISGSIFDSPGIMNFGDDKYKRYTFNTKVSSKMNDHFTFNANVRISRSDIDRPSYNRGLYYHNIARRWPVNGVVMPNGSYSDGSEIPFLLNGGRNLIEDLGANASLNLIYEPIENLKFSANLLYRLENYESRSHNAKVGVIEPNGQERLVRRNNSYSSYASKSTYLSPNFTVSYKKSFNEVHNFEGLLGFQQEDTKYGSVQASKNDLITDNVPSIDTAVGEDNVGGSQGSYATQGYFGRFTYNFKEKYLIEVAGRYDASSRFAEDSRWDVFPSFAVGYNIAKEDFWSLEKINLFKLRFSTGAIGNQVVPNYLYIGRMPIRTNLWWLDNTGSRPNYTLTPGIISPDITWETVKTDNFGLDINAFNNKLSTSFEYFIRTTDNMFGPAERLPGVLGTGVPQSNNATIRTKGFDFSVAWKDNIGEINYNLGFILSDGKTKVINYKNPNNLLNTFREGQTLGEIWGFETIGLYQSQDEIDNSPTQSTMWGGVWKPGDVRYKDLNGDNQLDWGNSTTDDPGDRKIIGNSTPRYNYSINAGASYKGIDFSMFWQGVGKRDVWAGGPYTFGAVGNLWQSAGLKPHLDYWSENNTDAYYPRPTFNNTWRNQQTQTRYMQNGAYLRLKNVTLGYSFQTALKTKLHLSKLRVYVTGENLLTFTKMSDVYDPEATGGYWGNGKIYPLQKAFAIGMNIEF